MATLLTDSTHRAPGTERVHSLAINMLKNDRAASIPDSPVDGDLSHQLHSKRHEQKDYIHLQSIIQRDHTT